MTVCSLRIYYTVIVSVVIPYAILYIIMPLAMYINTLFAYSHTRIMYNAAQFQTNGSTITINTVTC